MDRIILPCNQCGRPLAATPAMKTRKCAACGSTTKITAVHREQAIPLKDTADKITASVKKPQLDPGKTAVVKRRAARPVANGDDGGQESK